MLDAWFMVAGCGRADTETPRQSCDCRGGWAVEGASLGEGAMLIPVPPEQGQFAGPE